METRSAYHSALCASFLRSHLVLIDGPKIRTILPTMSARSCGEVALTDTDKQNGCILTSVQRLASHVWCTVTTALQVAALSARIESVLGHASTF